MTTGPEHPVHQMTTYELTITGGTWNARSGAGPKAPARSCGNAWPLCWPSRTSGAASAARTAGELPLLMRLRG